MLFEWKCEVVKDLCEFKFEGEETKDNLLSEATDKVVKELTENFNEIRKWCEKSFEKITKLKEEYDLVAGFTEKLGKLITSGLAENFSERGFNIPD